MTKCYIAGPMRGYPLYNFNKFFKAAMQLRRGDVQVVNPAERDMAIGLDPSKALDDQPPGCTFALDEAMEWDLEQVEKADRVFLLKGWEHSVGARMEVARAIGTKTSLWEESRTRTLHGDQLNFDPLSYEDAIGHMLRAVAPVKGSKKEAS